MNYRHIYHAGNFADVFKHWIITLILERLCIKDKPFCILDTHAGIGFYDLHNENAQKTLEAESGVNLLLDKKTNDAFAAYLKIVKDYMQHNIYPGSPAIMQHFLRDNDRMFLNELHIDDFAELKQNFIADKRIRVLHDDAYLCIKALLPPIERRGFVLIDPPFEQTNEFEQIITGLQDGLKRFATGIFAIWYPIKDRKTIDKFYKKLQMLLQVPAFYVELHANESILNQLNSCGMVVINPPWQLFETLQKNMTQLLSYLEFKHGSYKLHQIFM